MRDTVFVADNADRSIQIDVAVVVGFILAGHPDASDIAGKVHLVREHTCLYRVDQAKTDRIVNTMDNVLPCRLSPPQLHGS